MNLPKLFIVLPLACAAFAQRPATLSVPVNRPIAVTPDQVQFTIAIAASLESTDLQVKQLLQSVGLPNPTVVATGLALDTSRSPSGILEIQYSAGVTVPIASGLSAAQSLEALRTHRRAPLAGLQYSAAFSASQAAFDAAYQTALPQLINDARTLAQSLAASSGFTVGAIRSITDSPSAGAYALGSVPTAAMRAGDFSGIANILLGVLTTPRPSGQNPFAVTVVFATTTK